MKQSQSQSASRAARTARRKLPMKVRDELTIICCAAEVAFVKLPAGHDLKTPMLDIIAAARRASA